MRNLKRALSLALATVMTLGLMVVGTGAAAAGYDDVTSEDNVEAIEVLQTVGIMTGDENGNFNPDANVTRNEMAVIMSQLLNLNYDYYRGTNPFTDVPSWAAPYVAACAAEGVVAGIGDNLYGGDNNVTAAQAALMIMKALGYFQYQNDFGSDWQLATISKGSSAGLFDDVNTSATQALTRNDAAQMVLNALEASMVEADGSSGVTVEGNGFTVSTGSATYNDRTSSSNDYGAIDDERDNNDGRYVIQLGEDLYDGDLRKSSDTDDFGRPATIWNYGSTQIGTYADTADETWTTTVEERDLYQAAGSSAFSNYSWTVLRSGELVENGDGEELDGVSGADVLDYSRTSSERWQQTGNGVLTELFLDSSSETVTVTIIDTFVAEVTRVTDNGDDYTVTISYQTSRPSGAETTYDTDQEFAEDDIVLVTIGSQEIQSMAVADMVEGTVTGVSENSYVRVDGVTFDYNRAYTGTTGGRWNDGLAELDDGGQPEVDNDVVIYLDAYGYAVAVEGAESGIDDYLYITGLDSAYGDVSAKVVFADGTEDTIDLDEYTDEDGQVVDIEYDNGRYTDGIAAGNIYIWSASGSSYDLEYVDSIEPSNGDIRRDRATIIEYDEDDDVEARYTANTSTVYVDIDNNRTWTGYNNVTSKTNVEGALVRDGSIVEVVFIESSSNSSAEEDDYVYIASTSYETTTVDGDTVYVFYDAYVNGEETEFYVSGTSARNTIRSNGEGLYVVTEYDGSNDEWATEVSPEVVLDPQNSSTLSLSNVGKNGTNYAEYAESGVLTLADDSSDLTGNGKDTFSYDDNTVFVTVELQGNNDDTDTVSVGRVNDIEAVDDGEDPDEYTTAVYVLTVEDASDDTPLAELVMVVVPSEDADTGDDDSNLDDDEVTGSELGRYTTVANVNDALAEGDVTITGTWQPTDADSNDTIDIPAGTTLRINGNFDANGQGLIVNAASGTSELVVTGEYDAYLGYDIDYGVTAGSMIIRTGTVSNGNKTTVEVSEDLTISGDLTVRGDGTVEITSGTSVTVGGDLLKGSDSDGVVIKNSGTIEVAGDCSAGAKELSGNSLYVTGDMTGDLTIDDAGYAEIDGEISGKVTVTNGTLTVNGTLNASSLSGSADGTIVFGDDAAVGDSLAGQFVTGDGLTANVAGQEFTFDSSDKVFVGEDAEAQETTVEAYFVYDYDTAREAGVLTWINGNGSDWESDTYKDVVLQQPWIVVKITPNSAIADDLTKDNIQITKGSSGTNLVANEGTADNLSGDEGTYTVSYVAVVPYVDGHDGDQDHLNQDSSNGADLVDTLTGTYHVSVVVDGDTVASTTLEITESELTSAGIVNAD